MIKAEIIADSVNQFGNRLTTFVVVFPRIVLAEFNTHRMLSRNSASSRAIPFEKMLKMVEENPFIPIKWMKDHSGMQGNEYFPKEWVRGKLAPTWLEARDRAVETAKYLSNTGLTKQICNRLLEPFMWHTVIVTASEWENFFALRAHPAAEIHIQDLAHKMLDAYNASTPKQLKPGEWHIPFGDKMDEDRLMDVIMDNVTHEFTHKYSVPQAREMFKVKIATARCARVSYMNFDGSDDYQKDIELHDRLASMGHWSPFEHCAKVMNVDEYNSRLHKGNGGQPGWSGNFQGFIQYRKEFKNENKTDDRVIKTRSDSNSGTAPQTESGADPETDHNQ